MSLTQERKHELIEGYQVHETDTGSADVQIAMLSERISRLSDHLKANPKDHASRRGLMQLLGRRKRLLGYLRKEDSDRYKGLIQRLGIRG
ncbi:MAG TPA: 30S ribosomal protein S15 [Coleofasciculaceae cyanobacterium]